MEKQSALSRKRAALLRAVWSLQIFIMRMWFIETQRRFLLNNIKMENLRLKALVTKTELETAISTLTIPVFEIEHGIYPAIHNYAHELIGRYLTHWPCSSFDIRFAYDLPLWEEPGSLSKNSLPWPGYLCLLE